MKQYKILITSTLGQSGDLVELDETTQTKERLAKGIIAEHKIVAQTEKKTVKK